MLELDVPGEEVAEGVALAGVMSDFANVQMLETNLKYEPNLFPATPNKYETVKIYRCKLGQLAR